MSYTHCRGCGRELFRVSDMADGLCSMPRDDGRFCFKDWLVSLSDERFDGINGTPVNSIERSIAIDEWLAATR